MQVDFVVVGGGIVGISTAWELSNRHPGKTIAIIDKETDLARHQTGHNSGVIHAGVYYQPGSLKAKLCKEGAVETVRFCQEHGLAYDPCGKMLVATTPLEMERMDALYERCAQNGIETERVDRAELHRREPHIVGLGAIYVPSTGITDYAAITRTMAKLVQDRGGQIRLSTTVLGIHEERDHVTVATDQGDIVAGHVIVCGGLMADRLARMAGIETDFRIIPFRGEYYRLPTSRNAIVNHLIYPIPDPALPFLGVHLTRMIDGSVTVGPNAVLGWAREGYSHQDVNLRDLAEMFAFKGFWKVIARNYASGAEELWNSLSRKRYLKLCQKYCPELTVDDLLPNPNGVRAQAVFADGTLAHDFIIEHTARTVHVCNAPSPAATSAIPIGRFIADKADQAFAD
ncbi:MAG TPA: L-2-hydroxyglutarate oxidase [Magnetovibrio sp.]